jgi:uncharacterized membrane protein
MISLKSFRSGNLSVSVTMHEWLLASSCFSCLLLLGRMLVTKSLGYIFLPWNLFLAFVPYWITWWMMTRNAEIIENRIKLFIALAAWLLFIPNSFYIITDLFHFTHIRSAPKWFDLLLIFSFAWNGILCGIISLRRVEIVLSLIRGKGFSLFIVFAVMWLSSFGIYIGRYLRYNSWDIISDPFSLAGEITNMVFHPFDNLYVWGMVSCYSVFMTLLYFTLKKLSESFSTKK